MEKKLELKDLTEGLAGVAEDEMLAKFEDFLKYIEANGYEKVPSRSAFADYIGHSRSEVYKWISAHPFTNDKMRNMLSDTLVAGAMLKKYVANVTSFTLKNWCGWEEAPKTNVSEANKMAKQEKKAQHLLDEYIAEERLLARQRKSSS